MSLSSGNLSSRSGVLGIVRDRTHELRDWGANEDSPQHNHQQSQQQQQLQMQLQIEPEDDVTTLPEDSVSYIASWGRQTIIATNTKYDKTTIELYRDSVSEIKEAIESLRLMVRDIKGLQTQFINSPNLNFGNQTSESEQIDAKADEIKQVSNGIKAAIRVLQKEIEEAKRNGDDPQGVEMRERKTLCRSMTKLMLEVTSDYYECQMQYQEKLRNKIQRQLELADQGYSAEDIERMYEANMNVYSQAADNLYLSMTVEEAEAAKVKATERHEGMAKLMKALSELQELFNDLALWIEDQGELMDSVELHVENSVDMVRKATKDTRQAVLYARAARRKQVMIVILVTVLVGGLVAGGLLFLQSQGIVSLF